MAPQTLIAVLGLVSMSCALENLRLVYQWKQVDFNYSTPQERERAISTGEFVPENNLPLGLEIFGDRLFITVPRWRTGVPASLTYINLKDPSESPKLNPYPNWAAHKLPASEDGEPPEIVSPFRIRADQCGRLWVLDTGVADIIGKPHIYSPAHVIIYDLRTDALIRRYPIPADQVSKDSFLANIVVEDEDCANAYGYFGDLGDPAVVVYSFQKNDSWRLKHRFFNYNPLFAEFNVLGSTFIWTDGIFGMGLTAPESDGFSTLYFHPMTGTHEFSVSTRHLQNASLSETNFKKFRVVGNRGPNGQSSVSFLDKKSGVLFYALVNHNAIGCWRTDLPTYTSQNQGRIHESNVTMVFPNDIKVDVNDNVWVLSDRLPFFLSQKLNQSEFNYRILTAPLSEAVKNTPCDADAAPLSNKFDPASSMTPAPEDLPEIFNNFQRPTTVAVMAMPPVADRDNKIKPPVQAFAIAEIPDTFNKFNPPSAQPLFSGKPDLSFMFAPTQGSNGFKPPQGGNVFNSFQPPIQVPIQGPRDRDENSPNKGFEFMINVPVNLYISVENP